jgi:hypothetical protein
MFPPAPMQQTVAKEVRLMKSAAPPEMIANAPVMNNVVLKEILDGIDQ